MYNAKEYSYRVFWDGSDNVFVATVIEFPSLSHADDDQNEALKGMTELVAFVLEDMKAKGEELPVPLGKRTYSGKIVLRMPPEVHKRVALEAAEQAVSINQLLVSRI